jgi:hypothetical protein
MYTIDSRGIIVLGSNGPTYLKYMLGVDIKTNGVVSGLPMLSRDRFYKTPFSQNKILIKYYPKLW